MIISSIKHSFGQPSALHEALVCALDSVITTSVGPLLSLLAPVAFHFWLTGTSGAVTATVSVYGSNDLTALTSQTDAGKVLLGTTSALSGTGGGEGVAVANDALPVFANYLHYWAEVTAISGTDTKVFGYVVSS